MRFIQIMLLSFFVSTVFAQGNTAEEVEEVKEIKPSIMVIPFVKEGQQLRTVYERDDKLNLRIAVTKVKETFDDKDIPTIDFRAKVKQVQVDEHMNNGNQTSIKQKVIELSGADIYVEVEATILEDPDGNSVSVNATAFDVFSGQVLASGVGTTPKFYTMNFEKLTQKAVNSFMEEFTKNIQNKFDALIKEGRVVVVDIGFDENAEIDMDTEMEDGRLFSDHLEDWFTENAFGSYFHIQGVTATKMILDEVRIPVKEESSRNYRVTKFAAKLRSFLKKQGLDVTRDVVGSKIYITIN